MPGKNDKSSKSKTSIQHVYAYVFNGGVLKQNHCVVGVSLDHPETTVFNEYKVYYGDIKGAYYKTTKSIEEIKTGIKFKLSKYYLTDILYNHNFTETKKIILDVTGLKQCSGTINIFHKKDSVNNELDESENEESEEESEEEKKTKNKKNKNKKIVTEEVNTDSKKVKDSKESKKSKSSKIEIESDDDSDNEIKSSKSKKSKNKDTKILTKSSKKKEIDSDNDSDDEDIQPKKNTTSIELSDDDSDEEEIN